MNESFSLLTNYLVELQDAIASIPIEILSQSADLIYASKPANSVFIAGNGGSAATASHFATDLGVGSLRKRNPIRAISLSENMSVLTATSNDLDFSEVYSQQLKLHAQQNDIFIAISASGNSKNLINAMAIAKTLQLATVSITGFDGGELSKVSSLSIHIPTKVGSYGVVEDIHLSICHMITELIRSKND